MTIEDVDAVKLPVSVEVMTQFLDLMPHGFVIVEGEHGPILWMNRIAASLLGVDAPQIAGTPSEQVVSSSPPGAPVLTQSGSFVVDGRRLRTSLRRVRGDDGATVRYTATTVVHAVEGLTREQELRRYRSQMDGVSEIVAVLASFTESDKLLQDAVDRAREIVGADYGALVLLRDSSKVVADETYLSGFSEDVKGKIMAVEPDGMMLYITGGHTVHLDDITKLERFKEPPSWHPKIGPVLGVPVKTPDGVPAALFLERDHGAEPFTASDLSFAVLIARITSVALRVAVHARELDERRTKAERLNQAKSDFIAQVSHEVRTPLTGVMGLSELLLDTRLSSEQREMINTILHSGDQMLTLLNDLLDMSKIEAGKIELERRPFDLVETVEETVALHAGKAFSKGLEVSCLIAPGVPQHVIGDGGRIRQILSNLINNAIKFTAKGDIVVSVAMVAPDGVGEDPRVAIAVRDTGVGIHEHDLERVFRRFERTEQAFATEGTGLGLAICRKLADKMGGALTVTSQPEQGSTFTLTVPLEQVDVGDDQPFESASLPFLRGKRVLVADDSPFQREAMRQSLRMLGMEVETVGSGGEALEGFVSASYTNQAFDLILIDMQMPGLDGVTTSRTIRSLPDGDQVPIILLSAMSEYPTGALSSQVPRSLYLSKPVRRRNLRRAIVDAIGPQTILPPPTIHHLSRMSVTPSMNVLLADDNAVNRSITRKMLERMGHKVHVVSDGQQVLDFVRDKHDVDIIFMDARMPVLDGLEATKRLRALDRSSQALPIIAMTAQAGEQERAAFLAAGVNDHLVKPVKASQLKRILARWAVRDDSPSSSQVPRITFSKGTPVGFLDLNAALEALNGDEELMREVVALVVTDVPSQMSVLQRAVESRTWEEIHRLAHGLKGAVATVGARHMASAAQALVDVAKQKDSEQLGRAWMDVAGAWSEVEPMLQTLKTPT